MRLIILALMSFSAHLPASEKLSIVFAADLPLISNEEYGDYPQLATILKEQRQQQHPVFFLFGGGVVGPSPMSSFDRGAHIIDILNSLEPDAMGVTKREFSYFEDELSLRSSEAAFPMVSSNLYDTLTQSNLDGLVGRAIIEKSGVRIGVLSVLDASLNNEYLITRILVRSPKSSVMSAARQLRQEGVDLIVLLHSSPFGFLDELLTDGILDATLMSDPHFSLTNHAALTTHPNGYSVVDQGQALVIDIQLPDSPEKGAVLTSSTLRLNDFDKDPEVYFQVEQYSARLKRLLDENIAQLGSGFETTRPVVRGQESAFGNLLADAVREFAKTDIAFINGGLIRGEKIYQPGYNLTREDIITELPFRARLQVIELTGKQLLSSLENGVSMVDQLKGKFMQISGVSLTYAPDKPVGERLISATVGGQPVDIERMYTIATTSYLASGGDDYTMFAQARKINSNQSQSPLISDILIYKMRKEKIVSPVVEGRIKTVGIE